MTSERPRHCKRGSFGATRNKSGPHAHNTPRTIATDESKSVVQVLPASSLRMMAPPKSSHVYLPSAAYRLDGLHVVKPPDGRRRRHRGAGGKGLPPTRTADGGSRAAIAWRRNPMLIPQHSGAGTVSQ